MHQIQHGRFAELDGATVFALARLRQTIFVVEQECAYPDLDEHDTHPDTTHFWIGAAGEAIACLRLLRDGERWRIGRVCCAVDSRGRGLPGSLMAAAIESVGPEAEIVLDSQIYAAGFYRHYGFAEDGPEYVEDGIPHVPMLRTGKEQCESGAPGPGAPLS
ncbi:GNAT family N-acetyltransferase [Glycomyces buryatensis]|uniref:GNAT family N-acetyltransferase n=1 Tax=Glycomyces buryatensis TaxID=2570927 RepID=A0A4V4HRZ7_9ACTN|nr:GNAT family N-acetyltransferase [Glycomyces buryatensis]THV38616.1 GNAT family N-acetyltransferase [Glycomyces buryatensis]